MSMEQAGQKYVAHLVFLSYWLAALTAMLQRPILYELVPSQLGLFSVPFLSCYLYILRY